jgi:hypothetical protein
MQRHAASATLLFLCADDKSHGIRAQAALHARSLLPTVAVGLFVASDSGPVQFSLNIS